MADFSRLEKPLKQVALMVDSLEMANGNGQPDEPAYIPTSELLFAFDYPPLGFHFET